MIKAGSTVKHIPTGERLFVLGINKELGKACIAGYPPSIVYLTDCELERKGIGITEIELDYRTKAFGLNWDAEDGSGD